MTAMTFDTPLRTRPYADRPAVPSRVAPSPRGSLRLTRRGRLLVLLAIATLLLVAFSLGRTSASAGSASSTRAPAPTTVVQPGETLWAIARRVAPGADPRATVARLTDLNDLGSHPIVAGQRLVLPR
jgi:hypothetical protein